MEKIKNITQEQHNESNGDEMSMNELLNKAELQLKLDELALENIRPKASFEITGIDFKENFASVKFDFDIMVDDFTFNNTDELSIDVSCFKGNKNDIMHFSNTMELIRSNVISYIKEYIETSKVYINAFYNHFGKKYFYRKETFEI